MQNNIPYKKIGIFLLSLAIFFLAGEAIIRLYLLTTTVYDIEMSRYATIMKADSSNPLIGHVHKPNTSARLMNVMVHINSDGFRDREHQIEKSEKYRIIFLGDSLTFGWGVEDKDTFKSFIEKRLNKLYPAEIINFGTGNYNTEQEVNLFLEKGLKYKPDEVVVFYFINDAETTPVKSHLWFLGYSHLITFYWSRVHALINNLVPSRDFYAYYAGLYQDDQAGWRNTRKAFLELRDICQRNGIKLKVVLLPELHDTEHYPFQKEYALVESFLTENNVSSLNLSPFFKEYKDPMRLWVAKDDAHPNGDAHKLIADHAMDFIARRI